MRGFCLLPLVVTLLVGGLSCTSAAKPGNAMVGGVVTAAPTCPVQREGETCSRPISRGTVTAQPGGATTALDANGIFAMELEPGTYTLAVTTPQALSCPPAQTTLIAGHTTTIDFTCDTGIR
jgi:hypothetical protein